MVDFEEIEFDVTKHGFPTFEEFRRNPDRWREQPEGVFATVEKAGNLFKGYIRRIKYELEGYRFETLHEVQRAARNMGYRDSDLTFQPEMVEAIAGKCDVIVRFVSKASAKRRENW